MKEVIRIPLEFPYPNEKLSGEYVPARDYDELADEIKAMQKDIERLRQRIDDIAYRS